ncbi:MAG: response regulator, partial [Pseudomonadota bacterium]|nr:response regulator [Pseudomonadota bacterium]
LAVTDAMRGVSLRSILQTELGPYQAEETSQAILSGPLVGLRADVAPMLALVFHELISNAAKYGALSSDEGIVKAQWSLIEDKRLEFSWRELGGPPVKEPERHGFGRSLIENAIPYEFDGECELVYDPAGVRFSFSIPAVTLVKIEEETEHKAAIREGAAVQSATAKNALVVEDNMVLSMDMIESLKRLGANSVQNAGSIQSATKLVEENDFDFAVLDMNLRGEVVFDIALALQAKGTPFIFVSGYGSDAQTPHELSGVTILAKPVSDLSLSKAIAGLFA